MHVMALWSLCYTLENQASNLTHDPLYPVTNRNIRSKANFKDFN